MKKPLLHHACILVASALAMSATAVPLRAQQTVGLLSKVILDVSRRSDTTQWEKALLGQTLGSGDMLRTGARSFAIIKFKDNSMVRVRELSEVTVGATSANRALSKTVDVKSGGVGFTVIKQQTPEEFRFSSPTSVASIRGTAGLFATGREDTLVVIEGEVVLENKISGKSALVKAGFTGISSSDGNIVTRPSTRNEQQSAESASRSGDQMRQLKMQLRNARGERKEIILDFKD